MFEFVKAGGWLMLPIIVCSIVAVAIIVERFWSLQRKRITPLHLVAQVWHWAKANDLDEAKVNQLRSGSPLGKVIAAGLINRHHPREIMKESIEDAGRHIVPELERFLNTLGTIAAVTPLLGLLGTVVGMIDVFAAIIEHGVGNPAVLAEGISKALVTTAAGLSVAIPALMFSRYFKGYVNELILTMEKEAVKLVEVIHGDRESSEVEAEFDGISE
ncbi:MAG: MotA/TolQ/ExbB proton channel family protein [Sulfuriflexus sp.]|nr:MotA/TolQ/ExbB proton channel family protein [Sulfuriflexus sp.]